MDNFFLNDIWGLYLSVKLAKKLNPPRSPLARSLSEPPRIYTERVDGSPKESPIGSPVASPNMERRIVTPPQNERVTSQVPYWYRMHLRRQVPPDCIRK